MLMSRGSAHRVAAVVAMVLSCASAAGQAGPRAARVAAIDKLLAELQPERSNLRETTRALRLPGPGAEALVAAYRQGPDIRRIVLSERRAGEERESTYTWDGQAVVHVQIRLLRPGAAAATALSEDRLWLERRQPIQWVSAGKSKPLPDAAAIAQATRALAMADSMRRLMMTALPRGRDRCDWACAGDSAPPCAGFRCR